MTELKQDFPCLICGQVLYRVFDNEGQPSDGVICTTYGNYGSRVFDDLSGEYLAFNICDSCLRGKSQMGRVFISQASIPVWVEGAICGAYPVDRPYVAWNYGLEPSDERFTVDVEDIVTGNYPKSIRWNDCGTGNWPDTLAGQYLDDHPDEVAEWKAMMPEYAERIDAIRADYARRLASPR